MIVVSIHSYFRSFAWLSAMDCFSAATRCSTAGGACSAEIREPPKTQAEATIAPATKAWPRMLLIELLSSSTRTTSAGDRRGRAVSAWLERLARMPPDLLGPKATNQAAICEKGPGSVG